MNFKFGVLPVGTPFHFAGADHIKTSPTSSNTAHFGEGVEVEVNLIKTQFGQLDVGEFFVDQHDNINKKIAFNFCDGVSSFGSCWTTLDWQIRRFPREKEEVSKVKEALSEQKSPQPLKKSQKRILSGIKWLTLTGLATFWMRIHGWDTGVWQWITSLDPQLFFDGFMWRDLHPQQQNDPLYALGCTALILSYVLGVIVSVFFAIWVSVGPDDPEGLQGIIKNNFFGDD